jgi:hypothetical protein
LEVKETGAEDTRNIRLCKHTDGRKVVTNHTAVLRHLKENGPNFLISRARFIYKIFALSLRLSSSLFLGESQYITQFMWRVAVGRKNTGKNKILSQGDTTFFIPRAKNNFPIGRKVLGNSPGNIFFEN